MLCSHACQRMGCQSLIHGSARWRPETEASKGGARLVLQPFLGGGHHGVDHGHAYVGLHLLIQEGRQCRQVRVAQPPQAAGAGSRCVSIHAMA